MPIYEYRCQACGHEFEKLQKISDPVIRDCPACGQPEVKKLVSAAGFRLKGGGWYETDFKQSGKRNLAGEGSDKKAGSGDAKPASEQPASSTSDKPAKGSSSDKVA